MTEQQHGGSVFNTAAEGKKVTGANLLIGFPYALSS